MNNISALHARHNSPMPISSSVCNALWCRLDQARAVAECIQDKCSNASGVEAQKMALERIMALSGTIATLMELAITDTQALETMV